MSLLITCHEGVPKFKPAEGIGKKACDMSLIARIGQDLPLYKFIDTLQTSVKAARMDAHLLPPQQSHITLVNAILIEEPDNIPPEAEQAELFNKFHRALSSEPIRQMLSAPVTMILDTIMVTPVSVRLAAESPEWRGKRSVIATYLYDQIDSRFNLAEDHANFWNTIFRFKTHFSDNDYDRLQDLLTETANKEAPFTVEISLQNILAVRFPRKFLPWQEAIKLK